MELGYGRVSTDSQSVEAQVRRLTKAGCKKVFLETARRARNDRAHLRPRTLACDYSPQRQLDTTGRAG
jgi:DNA invertase Pin-like site-specific DNA recombinase